MRYFHFQKDELFCEEVSVDRIADKVKTPFYIYSYKRIVSNYERIKRAFLGFNTTICYSLKANSNLSICKILSSLGAGAEVVSGGELYTALIAGFSPEKIVFAGVGKTEEEIEYAIKKGILFFNVESEKELCEIAKIAEKLDKKAGISVRINPDVDPDTHLYITTGKKENKFGVSFEEAERFYRKAARTKNLVVRGIHVHIGSQIKKISPYLEAAEKISLFLEKLKKQGINLEYIDLGGGFGIEYREREGEFPLEEFAENLSRIFPAETKLILEPGRFIAGNAGALISRVLYTKKQPQKTFVVVDAGMNDLIRPSLYGAYHKILPVKSTSKKIREKVDVVGPVCESGDFFLKDALFPEVKKGELLAIFDAGAYGFSMSSNYNSRKRPAEVIVNGKKWWIVREREEEKDLLRHQRVPGELFVDEKEKLSLFSFPVEFWKMEATGNDFIVLDNRGEIVRERKNFSLSFCHRKKGIGADGVIFIEEADDADFTMRIFNPDGSEAEMCGNGARCAVLFSYLKGIAKKSCEFKTLSGKIKAEVGNSTVRIKMTDPFDLREKITLDVDGEKYTGYYINTGVPHFVIFFSDIEKIPLKQMGRKIRFHSLFHPQGTNVDIVSLEKDAISIRTYERGVEDETLSCGTGAVACALISSLKGNLISPIRVKTKGGELKVLFENKEGKFKNVFLEGKVNIVYQGVLNGRKDV